jgi:hypothetical protein
MKYYFCITAYCAESPKGDRVKQVVYVSDMFDDIEICCSELRYFDVKKKFPNFIRLKSKRVVQARTCKFFEL